MAAAEHTVPDKPRQAANKAGPSKKSTAERARLDRIFGDVLPETTSDERARGNARSEEPDADAWLRQNVPPHHG